MTSIEAEYAIVGGGIAGASLAARLAVFARVVLIEQEPHLGVHSTGRSAAIFITNYGGETVRALSRRSRRMLDEPPRAFARPLLRPRGSMTIAAPDKVEDLHVKLAGRSAGTAVPIGADKASNLVPVLRRALIGDAILDPTAADIDVAALHAGFVREARESGAIVLMGAGPAMAELRQGSWRVQAGDAVVTVPTLINASGAWADDFAASIGTRRLGLVPHKRTALLVDAPPTSDIAAWPFVIDVDETIYFKPDAGKILISPADATPEQPGDAQPDELDVAVAVHRFEQIADMTIRRVNHRWAGLRTVAADGLPVIGLDANFEGFFWLAGFGGFGVQTAPAVGEIAAELLRRDRLPGWAIDSGIIAERLSPGRLPPLN